MPQSVSDSTPVTATGRLPLRVAVIGFGARAQIAEHVAQAHPGARIVAIADPDAHGQNRAHLAYPEATVHATLDALVAAHRAAAEDGDIQGTIDAAIVTTPDHTHENIAILLLEAGIAVYLEKPLAITLEGADRVLIAAAETGTVLYVGHNYRHSSVVRTMHEIIQRGEIGEVKAVWVRHFVGHGGDYFFKDWHADRSKTNTLLLQKASHDIDVVHYLASGFTRRVVGMGDLMVYGGITDRRDRAGQVMSDWFSFENWPPASQTGLNPIVDVEDVSMMMMTLDNGVMASYQQCHFTPDYWRNYTVIGTEGRLENIGDTAGGIVKVWNRRHEWQVSGDLEYPIQGVVSGHDDADLITMTEFFDHLVEGTPTLVSPLAARQAVAVGSLAALSLRDNSRPIDVPDLPAHIVDYFTNRTA